jgi:hypothetical protein
MHIFHPGTSLSHCCSKRLCCCSRLCIGLRNGRCCCIPCSRAVVVDVCTATTSLDDCSRLSIIVLWQCTIWFLLVLLLVRLLVASGRVVLPELLLLLLLS